MGEPDAGHRGAEMLQSSPAVGAPTAVRERHDRDAVALGDARHAGPGRNHVARELVAEDLRVLRTVQRMGLGRRHDRASCVFMQVGAADAAGGDPHHDLARARRGRFGDILDPNVLGGMEAKRPHGTIRSARSREKRSVNDDSVSRTPWNPRRRLRPMSVNVSTVRPRSASVCHHDASFSTSRSRRP